MKGFLYDFVGYYPVGAYMLVIAESQAEADRLFWEQLPDDLKSKNKGMPDADSLVEIDLSLVNAYMISDGNY